MTYWTIKFSKEAGKQLLKLDKHVAKRIVAKLKQIAELENPQLSGKALQYSFSGLWRYRVGDYRIICSFQRDEMLILVVDVGHRKNIYHR